MQAAPSERAYDRAFRPQPEQMPPLTLVPMESHGRQVDRAAMRKSAVEQNLLNDFEHEERLRAYRLKLQETTDAEWRHEMASGDDYRDGRRHFQSLWDEQVVVDPSGDVWRSIAPKGFAIPDPRLPGISCSQCGQGFGLGKQGFSHCADHTHLRVAS